MAATSTHGMHRARKRREQTMADTVVVYTAQWHVFRLLRWCRMGRLNRRLFSTRTEIARVYDRKGRPMGVYHLSANQLRGNTSIHRK